MNSYQYYSNLIPSKPIFETFSRMFVNYLHILKIIVNNLQGLQLSIYFFKMKSEVCKLFENNTKMIFENVTKIICK